MNITKINIFPMLEVKRGVISGRMGLYFCQYWEYQLSVHMVTSHFHKRASGSIMAALTHSFRANSWGDEMMQSQQTVLKAMWFLTCGETHTSDFSLLTLSQLKHSPRLFSCSCMAWMLLQGEQECIVKVRDQQRPNGLICVGGCFLMITVYLSMLSVFVYTYRGA